MTEYLIVYYENLKQKSSTIQLTEVTNSVTSFLTSMYGKHSLYRIDENNFPEVEQKRRLRLLKWKEQGLYDCRFW